MELLEKIAEMAKVKSWHEVMDNFILPEVLKYGGSTRGYQISDEYMTVCAEFGQIIYQSDVKTAEVLLEFAMQRLSCGAVKHKYLGTALNVPQKYVYYSTFQDKPAPMSEACWDFLQRGFPVCLVVEKLKKHARAILMGLIYNLDYKTGQPINGYQLGDVDQSNFSIKDWAWCTAKALIPFEEFWPLLVKDDWLKYKDYFTSQWDKFDLNKFHSALVAKVPAQEAWPDLALDGWERHIAFFHQYWPMVDTKRFFELIGVTSLAKKAKISLKIKYYSA